ncbi:DUF1521 domain-containing protein [Pyxidicoccus fallax]|uniref:DUF1521 domain-containing protein n=1 Tax=Pyxidicoccus fallax TaxID=394095 RepID=A0A848LUA6_9BACT|nr:DUF1521 domain-containing protein [Pyxidicoccus fallax]NMO21608.1 DUF1521 domain-containing protein [Pyxidicoccus fallax]NPC82878.1 DUF1521 domain-containing protein [Pyxidicoccus fallax]
MSNNIGGIGNRQSNPTQLLPFGGPNANVIARNAKLIESTMSLVQKTLDLAHKFVDQMAKGVESQQGSQGPSSRPTCGCFPSEKPHPIDSVGDRDALKVDSNGKITTPGGYQIEQLGQFEWKVTGPDGKSTRVWGDPHVDESDGGKFDFKRDATFTLGDGTMINVTTKPYGNGMTVTGQLDVISGDSHVTVTDIDKGKGKVGQPTNDGFGAAVKFAAKGNIDNFQMGNETDDWVYNNSEVIGSEGGGDKIKTKEESYKFKSNTTNGNNGTNGTKKQPAWADLSKLGERFDALTKMFDQLKNTRSNGFNPFRKTDDMFGRYDRNEHRNGMTKAFKALGDMFRVLEQVSKLNDMVRFRGPQMF